MNKPLINTTPISISRIGHTGKAFRLQVGRSIFDIRTRSHRTFLVVNLRGRYAEKRTDNIDTALAVARRIGREAVIIDTRTAEFATSRFNNATYIERSI